MATTSIHNMHCAPLFSVPWKQFPLSSELLAAQFSIVFSFFLSAVHVLSNWWFCPFACIFLFVCALNCSVLSCQSHSNYLGLEFERREPLSGLEHLTNGCYWCGKCTIQGFWAWPLLKIKNPGHLDLWCVNFEHPFVCRLGAPSFLYCALVMNKTCILSNNHTLISTVFAHSTEKDHIQQCDKTLPQDTQ